MLFDQTEIELGQRDAAHIGNETGIGADGFDQIVPIDNQLRQHLAAPRGPTHPGRIVQA